MIAEREFSDESSAFDAHVEKSSQDLSVPVTNFEAEKSDSGMEEESFLQDSADISEETDEENEIVGRKRPKGKKLMIIDDDDDDEDDDSDNSKGAEVESKAAKSIVTTDGTDINEKEQDGPDSVDGDVDVNKDSQLDSSSLPTEIGNGDDNNDNESEGDQSPLKLKLDNKDLFDAESSDEEPADHQQDRSRQGEEAADSEENDEENEENENETNENDEGFDEDELDPELLKKLKKLKGASKSAKDREKYSRKAKPTADKMLEIYSESQRLTRDSRVNLPYYEPQEKSLDDFLARASKKKQEYAALKKASDFQKAQIIHEKLAVTPPKLTLTRRSSKKAGTKTSPSQDSSALPLATVSDEGDNLHDSGLVSQEVTLSQSQQASQEVAMSQPQQASQSSTVVLQSSLDADQHPRFDGDKEEDTDLPDLVEQPSTVAAECASVTQSTVIADTKVLCLDNAESEINRSQPMDVGSTKDEAQSESADVQGCNSQTNTIPSLQKDPSRDLFSSQSVVGQGSEPLYHETLETDQRMESVLQSGEFDPSSSLVTVVNETPQSTQATQLSTLSVCSSVTSGQVQTTLKTAGVDSLPLQASEEGSQVDMERGNVSAASIKDLPHVCEDAANASKSKDTVVEKHEAVSASKSHKKSIMDKLQLQGLPLPPAPKLLGTPNDMICLDEPEVEKSTPKNPGVLNLMDRLARHNQKKAPKQAYDVDISIIEKENVQGQEELKLKSVKYHVQPEEQLIPSDGAPGSCRLKLNQYLKSCMKIKREDGRRKRIEQHQLDNEEGFERAEEDQEEEEEEAEMTDDENEDSDEDEEEAQLDDYGAGSDDDGEDYNPLLDNEARDDDEEEEEDEEDQSDFNEDSNDFHLNFEVSDEEEGEEDNKDNEDADNQENEDDELELTSLKKKKRRSTALLSDDEDDEKEKTEGDTERKKPPPFDEEHTSQSLWSSEMMMTPLSKHLEDTQPQGQTKFRRQSSCSPDLYATASVAEESESSPGPNSHNDSHSQSFDYAHSQMLDADGYLKVAQTQRPPKSRISLLAQNSSDDANAFGSSMSIGKIFGGVTSQAHGNTKDNDNDDDDENMKELMGLCSGKFPKADDEDSLPSSQSRLKRTQSFEAKGLFDDGYDDDVYDPFHVLSQDENAQDFQSLKQKSVFTDSDDENKENKDLDEADSDDGSEDEESTEVHKFTGFKDKKRGIRREFLEEEAELSGSEFDSDENLDLAEEDDILEEEEGDRDTAGLSESKLRNQVGRLHMKQLQDDDDREIMRYKEMYLQDGDLYTDGKGRRRNFRWKDIDNNSQQDMFTNESDEEPVEEDPEETQWRKHRYERDKFLEESETKGSNEDSQLVKLGQGFLQKKDSFGLSSQEFLPSPKEKSANLDKKKFQLPKKGSFLSRSKDALSKMAKMAKSVLGGNVKNSRGFVFQSVEDKDSQQEDIPMENPMQPPKRKAHTSSHQEQAVKKQKLNENAPSQVTREKPVVKRKNSILHLLD
ncbi:claspin [Elysia marginata]|uniref:Claspin n=1 Tax=Elysia marginata TaxID=1093978 RepID=A0AAV4JNJ4_9GAST|nr:claspin [Elysia marginata]